MIIQGGYFFSLQFGEGLVYELYIYHSLLYLCSSLNKLKRGARVCFAGEVKTIKWGIFTISFS